MWQGYVDGQCNPHFEPVKKIFEKFFRQGLEDKAQLCVYVGNTCVVDLYGVTDGNEIYGPNTLQVFKKYFPWEKQSFKEFFFLFSVFTVAAKAPLL